MATGGEKVGKSKIGNVISMNAACGTGISVSDCLFEPGVYGVVFNHSGAANRPVDLGGNRDYLTNAPIDVSA